MLRNNSDPFKQSGNVFVIILIGVVLFGALLYTFTRTAQTSAGNLTAQQAEIAAQEILNYARLLEGAVDRVRQNGCAESEISFENPITVGKYSNTNAPADNSCHIFEPEGGGLTWQDSPHGTPYIFNAYCISGIGGLATCADADLDLLFFLVDVDMAICLEVNNRVNAIDKTIAPTADDFNFSIADDGFEGSFAPSTNVLLNGATIDNFSTGCGTDNAGDHDTENIFYHTLLVR